MKLDDFRRFKGMMERTTSDNDHEALASMRAANRLLVREGLTWTRVLDRSVSINLPFETAADAHGEPDRDEMEALFEQAMEGANGEFRDVLESIHEQWERKHWLSPKQRQVVEDAARRSQERSRR